MLCHLKACNGQHLEGWILQEQLGKMLRFAYSRIVRLSKVRDCSSKLHSPNTHKDGSMPASFKAALLSVTTNSFPHLF